jgi:hypothetical protein
MRSKTSWTTALLAIASMGCGSGPINLGDDRDDRDDRDDLDPASIGASLSDYEGTWTGYAELAEWADGTGDIRIQLDAQGNGVLEVGHSAPLAPPVVDDGYPRDFEFAATAGMVVELLPGFSYPISGAVVESKRLRMQLSSSELYREYCALQTPMPVPGNPGAFNCRGITSYSSSGDPNDPCFLHGPGDEVIGTIDDCDPLMCFSACECNESECLPYLFNGPTNTQIDAELKEDGEELVGSLALPELLGATRPIYRLVMTRE